MKESTKFYKQNASQTHGQGLYAASDIPKGTRIIEYIGEKMTKAQSERRSEEWDSHARTKGLGFVYIFELNKRYDIDGNVDYNPAKYINHSCDPNCEALNIRGHIWILARRNIKEGEELSYDYGYDSAFYLDHPCLCGSKKCIGYIVAKDQRRKVKKLLTTTASPLTMKPAA